MVSCKSSGAHTRLLYNSHVPLVYAFRKIILWTCERRHSNWSVSLVFQLANIALMLKLVVNCLQKLNNAPVVSMNMGLNLILSYFRSKILNSGRQLELDESISRMNVNEKVHAKNSDGSWKCHCSIPTFFQDVLYVAYRNRTLDVVRLLTAFPWTLWTVPIWQAALQH